jgi:hypothetical protein
MKGITKTQTVGASMFGQAAKLRMDIRVVSFSKVELNNDNRQKCFHDFPQTKIFLNINNCFLFYSS